MLLRRLSLRCPPRLLRSQILERSLTSIQRATFASTSSSIASASPFSSVSSASSTNCCITSPHRLHPPSLHQFSKRTFSTTHMYKDGSHDADQLGTIKGLSSFERQFWSLPASSRATAEVLELYYQYGAYQRVAYMSHFLSPDEKMDWEVKIHIDNARHVLEYDRKEGGNVLAVTTNDFELCFFSKPPAERDVHALFRLYNTHHAYQSVEQLYRERLTKEEAADPVIIQEVKLAMKALRASNAASMAAAPSTQSAPSYSPSNTSPRQPGFSSDMPLPGHHPMLNPLIKRFEASAIARNGVSDRKEAIVSLFELYNSHQAHQRLIEFYQYFLTKEEAAHPPIIAECMAAQKALGMITQQQIDTTNVASSAAAVPPSSSSFYSPQQPPQPPQPRGLSAVALSSDSGEVHYRPYARTSSELRSDIKQFGGPTDIDIAFVEYKNERRRSRFTFWICLTAILGYASYYVRDTYYKDMTPEEIQASVKESWEKLKTGKMMSMTEDRFPVEKPKTRLNDVMGCEEAKAEMWEVVEYLKDPKKFTRLGGKMPKGVLLLGPPGTGKTLLARAVAGEADVAFFSATGADFEEMYSGVGAKRMRELFDTARKHSPAIVFIDEIDAVGGKRQSMDESDSRQTLDQLLTEMDGFKKSKGVIVIAATNSPDTLDKALMRPGRFDKRVDVLPPDIKGRKAILDLYAAKMKLDPQYDLNLIARRTEGMTGADLSQLLNGAALRAAAKDKPFVTQDDIEESLDTILMGLPRTTSMNSEEMKHHIAVYSSGQSLIALKKGKSSRPIHKVTIQQRGTRLGRMAFTSLTNEDIVDETYTDMLGKIDTLVGGRVAEEIVYGENGISSHATSDLRRANTIARAMVMSLGFGKEHGPQSDSEINEFTVGTSEHQKASVDKEVKQLLDDSYKRVKELLTKEKQTLERLTDALMKYETLDGKQIKAIVEDEKFSLPVPSSTKV